MSRVKNPADQASWVRLAAETTKLGGRSCKKQPEVPVSQLLHPLPVFLQVPHTQERVIGT
jgi:hypothetical protein